MTFGTLGFLLGAILTKKPLVQFPNKRLYVTYYLNSMMQRGLSWANNSGGAAFIYCINGWVFSKL